jgi:hypothetical protein
MHVKRVFATLVAAAMLWGTAEVALAQQPPAKPAPSMPGGDQRSMDHGMMGGMGGGGMMGMMNMMQECQRMMGGASAGGSMMPQMPPGNEKLQFQMHAEMMQRMGEIAAKYAERIQQEKR